MKTKKRLGYSQLGTSLPKGDSATRKDQQAQAFFREIIVDPDILTDMLDTSSHIEHNEKLHQARADLAEYIIKSAPTVLTERQWAILSMWLTGKYSQQQIADHLGIAQTTVCKTLNGNDAYLPDGTSQRHGGILTKLKIWAETDTTVQDLLRYIADLCEEES